jgi:phosphoserine phosphatase
VFELSISAENLLSHLYLKTLVDSHHLANFTIKNNLLCSDQNLPCSISKEPYGDLAIDIKGTTKLIIFTEGLNLQQLRAATQSLGDVFEFKGFSVVTVEGLTGFAICAFVIATTHNDINTALEHTANCLNIELCWVQQCPSLSQPGILLMDMDSTVISVECIDEIAALVGVGQQVSAVTLLAMQGKLDFAESLRTRVACLKGADESVLQTVCDALPLMVGAANLVHLLKTYDWKVAIASGGFSYFAGYLLDRLELDAAFANDLEIVDGKLTGQVKGSIVDAKVKAQTLLELADRWSIPHSQTIAMGDGANDLLMMNAAALGVALHAKPVVRQQADMAIRWAGLDTLLWVLAAGK